MFTFIAVQNERDRISCRRPSFEESSISTSNALTVNSLIQADLLSRQSSNYHEVCELIEESFQLGDLQHLSCMSFIMVVNAFSPVQAIVPGQVICHY
jgi:hypothetical protein